MYFSARTEGRISYGHLGRTNLFTMQMVVYFSRKLQIFPTRVYFASPLKAFSLELGANI